MKIYRNTLLLICLICSNVVLAQVSFTANVNKNPVGVNENFQLTFKVNNDPSSFSPPNLNDFHILSGPSTSSNISIINGNYRKQFSYSYVLRPKAKGSFVIPEAIVIIGSKQYRSKSIKMNVSAQLKQRVNPNDPYGIAQENVFLRALISKSQVYNGEALVLTYKLYYALEVAQISYENFPKFEGFWSKEVKLPNTPSGETQIYDGKRYNVAALKQFVLIPQKNGNLEIDPFGIEALVRVPTNEVDFFGRRRLATIKHKTSSARIKIVSQALPLAGRPPDFTGAVGQFKLSSHLSRTELKADESASLRIEIKGKGNLQLFQLPELQFPPDIESFDAKASDNVSITAGGMQGSKKVEYLLIPRYGGTYKIPAVGISYFDPVAKSYKLLSTEYFEIVVSGEQNNSRSRGNDQPVASGKQNVDYLDRDILQIKEQGRLTFQGDAFAGSFNHYSLLGLCFLGLIGLLFINKRREAAGQDMGIQRNKQASKELRKHLKEAKIALGVSNKDIFYQKLEEGIWTFLANKFNIRRADLSFETVNLQIKQRGLDASLSEKLQRIILQCQNARFSGQGNSEQMSELYELAGSFVDGIEKGMKK